MALPIIKATQAERDLLEIWVYIAEHSDTTRATTLLKALEADINILADMPNAGRMREELLSGLRSLSARGYVIYYRHLPDGILIMRVLHGSRQVESVFPGDLDTSE